MNYFIDRSIYYYFLVCEITDADMSAWRFIARYFGVKPKDIKLYEDILSDKTLAQLSNCNDIEIHKNYLENFCSDAGEFGRDSRQREVLELKALALHKIADLFGDTRIKVNRLRSLSHIYEQDHTAAVLYALRVLHLNAVEECRILASNILYRELTEGKNSDAGIVLLKLGTFPPEDVMSALALTPDMPLRPAELKSLIRHYGCADAAFRGRRTIGF